MGEITAAEKRLIEFRASMPENNKRRIDTTIAILDKRAEATHRKSRRLGASAIGGECERATWYGFRWASLPRPFMPSSDYYHPGQYEKIGNTGHRREAEMVEEMKMCGINVVEINTDTGEQFCYTGLSGHLVCYIDGKVYGIKEDPHTEYLWEGKTMKRKHYIPLTKKGIKAVKIGHYDQMQIGMALSGIDQAFYLAVSKDTEDIYGEIIPVNNVRCNFLLERAKRIIFEAKPPPPFSDDIGCWQCAWCDHFDICRDGEKVQRNCRTCLHASPAEHGRWTCSMFANVRAFANNKDVKEYEKDIEVVTSEEQEKGCKHHLYMPTLVPGTPIGSDGETVTYRMESGAEWTDRSI